MQELALQVLRVRETSRREGEPVSLCFASANLLIRDMHRVALGLNAAVCGERWRHEKEDYRHAACRAAQRS